MAEIIAPIKNPNPNAVSRVAAVGWTVLVSSALVNPNHLFACGNATVSGDNQHLHDTYAIKQPL